MVGRALVGVVEVSRELEVKGEVLNQLLETLGEERVAKNKRCQVLIVERPSRSKKK